MVISIQQKNSSQKEKISCICGLRANIQLVVIESQIQDIFLFESVYLALANTIYFRNICLKVPQMLCHVLPHHEPFHELYHELHQDLML